MMSQLCLKSTSAHPLYRTSALVVVQAIVVPTPCRGKLWPPKSAISYCFAIPTAHTRHPLP